MDMETVSIVLSLIAASLVILAVFLHLYSLIRPRFKSKVSCWFCGEKSKVAFNDRNSWNCLKCEQYNGFSADGGYNKVIPAQHDIRLNSLCTVSRPEIPARHGNGLCASCNVNQQLKVQQLATFVPFRPARFDEEVDEFSRHLDRVYALCRVCETSVAAELGRQGDWLMGLKVGAMRGRQWAQKQQAWLPGFLFKICRILTVVISLTLFAASLLKFDTLPSIFSLIPPEITLILEAAKPNIRLHLLGFGSMVQLAVYAGRWNRKDVVVTVLWMVANGIHWAIYWKLAEDFSYWNVVKISSLFGCLLAATTAACGAPQTSSLARRSIRGTAGRHVPQSAATGRPGGQVPSPRCHLNASKTSTVEDVSHLLHEPHSNISLPVGRSVVDEPSGGPMRTHDGLDTGIGRLRIGQTVPLRRFGEPPLTAQRNVLRETDMFPTFSRSSSQSSGFASQCSQQDDDAPRTNPFYNPASRQRSAANHNLTSADFVSVGRAFANKSSSPPSSVFGDASAAGGKCFSNVYTASVYPKSSVSDFRRAFSCRDVFEKPGADSASGKSYPSAVSSRADDDDFDGKSFRSCFSKVNRSRSGEFSPVRDSGFYPKPRSPASLDGNSRYGKDVSPNSTFSEQTYRNSFTSGSSFSGNNSSPNEMALVCAGHFRDDASVHSVGYQPVYLPASCTPGYAPGYAPGYVVNHCCHHSGKLATAMVVLGVLVNIVMFVSNSGLWPKFLDAFR